MTPVPLATPPAPVAARPRSAWWLALGFIAAWPLVTWIAGSIAHGAPRSPQAVIVAMFAGVCFPIVVPALRPLVAIPSVAACVLLAMPARDRPSPRVAVVVLVGGTLLVLGVFGGIVCSQGC